MALTRQKKDGCESQPTTRSFVTNSLAIDDNELHSYLFYIPSFSHLFESFHTRVPNSCTYVSITTVIQVALYISSRKHLRSIRSALIGPVKKLQDQNFKRFSSKNCVDYTRKMLSQDHIKKCLESLASNC